MDPDRYTPIQPDKRIRSDQVVIVTTIYKRKDRKVHPIDDKLSDRTVLERDPFWKLKKLDITE
jgi:hypothetical protein